MRKSISLIRAVALLLIIVYPATSFAFFQLPAASMPLALTPPAEAAPDSAAEDCIASRAHGHRDADNMHSSKKWFFGGFCSGVILGLIGTAIITVGARTTNPFPKDVPANVNEACYVNGYEAKGKSKNAWSAFDGGLIGTAILIGLYWASSNQ